MSLDERAPPELKRFLERGGTEFQTDEDDWRVRVEALPRGTSAPSGALVIATSGAGDFLFLDSTLGPQVFVHRRDGQRVEVFRSSLSELTDAPPPEVSKLPPVLYADGTTPVHRLQSNVRCVRRAS